MLVEGGTPFKPRLDRGLDDPPPWQAIKPYPFNINLFPPPPAVNPFPTSFFRSLDDASVWTGKANYSQTLAMLESTPFKPRFWMLGDEQAVWTGKGSGSLALTNPTIFQTYWLVPLNWITGGVAT
jgi:hypothetical protein